MPTVFHGMFVPSEGYTAGNLLLNWDTKLGDRHGHPRNFP